MADCPQALLADGNFIPRALHHLGYAEAAATMIVETDTPEQLFFERRRCRTYEQTGYQAHWCKNAPMALFL